MITRRTRIDPLRDIGPALLAVEKPARYLGGEVGSLPPCSDDDGDLLIALSFPDLYEIGMSNNAIRILYSELNACRGLRCERVFAPAPDFEGLLAARNLPLFTLESGIALCDTDIVGFSLGYELAATSVLAILQSGRVPLRASERCDKDPIVIMGGPAISNPHPFASFIDAAYIGEAEASFEELMEAVAELKMNGAGRNELLDRISEDKAIWMPHRTRYGSSDTAHQNGGGGKRAYRAIYAGFSSKVYKTASPIATIRPVQDHGTVEIMRGCPNGCRFCHAGFYYRPQRIKPYKVIREEVADLVETGGYREITLSSLSSGDYPGIEGLLDALNGEWAGRGISFQLPSLKISTFTLPLIEKLSETRKSGLTFAVETPNDAWQRIINKEVTLDQTIAILREAKAKGFKLAKFYFMIGLPVPGGAKSEAEEIVWFFSCLFSQVQIQLHVNIGIFVPKPHTPFQWCRQIDEKEASEAISAIKNGLRQFRSIKISFHSPFISVLEGLISRGDERVGELIFSAFTKGARLDAWEDYFRSELWREAFAESTEYGKIEDFLIECRLDKILYWDDISIRTSKEYLVNEYKRSIEQVTTSKCTDNCTSPCGACSSTARVVDFCEHYEYCRKNSEIVAPQLHRLLFSYSKLGVARFYPHLSISEAFNRAFLTTGLPIQLSEGFNPMPRLELIQPLPIGFGSMAELGCLQLKESLGSDSIDDLVDRLNTRLPRGLMITRAAIYPIHNGTKIRSLMSLSWGSEFEIRKEASSLESIDFINLGEHIQSYVGELPLDSINVNTEPDRIIIRLPDPERKDYGLLKILEACLEIRPIQSALSIVRTRCISKSIASEEAMDYFELFSFLERLLPVK